MFLHVVPRLQTNDLIGIIIWRPFDAKNSVHLSRKHKCYVDDDG